MVTLSAFAFAQSNYYVDPVNGNDGSNGTTPASAFKTIHKARNAVRAVNTNMNADIRVFLRGGMHYIDSTINFYNYDSGTNGHNIIYLPYNNEKPVISGGTLITGWTLFDAAKNIYAAPISPSLDFRQLYVMGKRAIRTREPDLTDSATSASYYKVISANPFIVNASEISNWNNLNSVECVWFAHWKHKRTRIASYSVNGSQATITFTSPESTDPVLNHYNQGDLPGHFTYYYYENAYEFIDQDREWYLNKTTNTLYYKASACESVAGVEFVVPKVQNLISISGISSAHVHNIQFYGLTFECSNWTKPNSTGYLSWQSGLQLSVDNNNIVPGMVQMDYASNIRFEGNTFRRSGSHGLVTANATRGNVFIGNTFSDLAGGGIYMNTVTGYCASTGDTIKDNLIESVGRIYDDAVGIAAANDSGMVIEHNLIRYCPYTGISIGWSWDTTSLGCLNNEIRYNEIHHVMRLHDDGGGIYTLGKMQGGNFHHNSIHNIKKSSYEGGYPIAGIYLDNGSKYKSVHDNVLDSTNDAFYAMNAPNLNNTFNNNFYNSTLGAISGQNTVQNNTAVSGSSWNAAALAIIGSAGLENSYKDILYSGKIPGLIEAENYSDMRCVQNITASDTGSGLNVGFIDAGDWMDYFVNVTSAGNYTFDFRLTSALSGAQFELRNGTSVLATVSVPNTTGWQTWQTVSVNVSLVAGPQTLRLLSTQASGWNINWFRAQPLTTGIADTQTSGVLKVYPNPSSGKFTVRVENIHGMNESGHIEIFNQLGETVLERQWLPADPACSAQVPPGMYFVRFSTGKVQWVQKLVVQR